MTAADAKDFLIAARNVAVLALAFAFSQWLFPPDWWALH